MMTIVLQYGWSPLNAASFSGHLDVVKTLLEAGANINQANNVGTCTHTSCHRTAIVPVQHSRFYIK